MKRLVDTGVNYLGDTLATLRFYEWLKKLDLMNQVITY